MSFTEEEVKAAWEQVNPGVWDRLRPKTQERLVKTANALSTKREGEPIVPKDIRKGDRVRVEYATGLEVIGEVLEVDENWVTIKGQPPVYISGTDKRAYLIHRATPQLPTKRPAAILATEVAGYAGEFRMILNGNGKWLSDLPAGFSYVIDPHEITAWKPADFVVREP